jgi:hypothetical protein
MGALDTMGRGLPVASLHMRPHSVSIAAMATAARKARQFKQPREETPRPKSAIGRKRRRLAAPLQRDKRDASSGPGWT